MRYADDFLLGFAGLREDAEEIKQRLAEFLQGTLKFHLSEAKILTTAPRQRPTLPHFSTLGTQLLVELLVAHLDQIVLLSLCGEM